jgi:putative DNA primase/helicase
MNDIKELKRNSSIVKVIGNYVHLEKHGPHHKGLCPFHEDTKPTLTVTESKSMFKCFACGEGGDQFDFLIRMGRTMPEAIEEIKNGEGLIDDLPGLNKIQKPAKIQWNPVYPFPSVDGYLHYKYGKPSTIWTYVDIAGDTIQHVCRYDFADGTKEVLPLIWATDGTKSEWRIQAVEKPRPLYNLDLINHYVQATILIVEGEKAADHAQASLDPTVMVATAWIGGSHGIVNADWSILNGRNVIYCPDHDVAQRYGENHKNAGKLKPWFEQPGNYAMLEIHKLIKDKISTSKWVNVPKDYPNKWDVADNLWDDDELIGFVYDNLTDVPVVDENMIKALSEAKPFIEPIVVNDEFPVRKSSDPYNLHVKNSEGTVSVFENDYFRFLGYDKDDAGKLNYFFFSFDAKTVVKLSPSSMTKSNLMMLAPINWWEQFYPGKTGVNIDAAQQFLIGYSHSCGTFKEKVIRGRGAWIDNKRFVIHTGDSLLVDGVTVALRKFQSKYVYEINEKLDFSITTRLESTDGRAILDMIGELRWERQVNATLLAGWCVIAPFCGVLTWRPHIWVTGPAGSGKSWTMEHVVKKLVGETGLVMQGKTTEAYVRGKLQNDALPVMFDESDVDSYHDKERVQSILALARSASYGNGGIVGKGTQTGGSKEYQIRSCFAFSSIGVQLNQQSDRSRFTMLGLQSFEGFKNDEQFADYHDRWNKLVTDDKIKQLHTRTMALLPVIIKNTKTFADAVAQVIGIRRIGDQVAGMLAGAYSLVSTKEISLSEAIEWVKLRDWNEEKGLEQTKDEFQLFSRIMSHVTFIDSTHGRVDRTVGELIMYASNFETDISISIDIARARLRRLGIIVTDKQMIIANSSPEIINIIKDSSWSKNYNKVLERIPESEKIDSRKFAPGLNSRAIGLPLSLIM